MADCCKTGFMWDGTPNGSEGKLASNDVYITGTEKKAAVMVIHDVFGWKLPNTRLLADQYAESIGATVYVPDFFDGEIVSTETFDDPVKQAAFDIGALVGRNSKEKRFPEMTACVEALREKYPKVAAIGFCYGGWAVFQLAALSPPLLSCISTAHPALLTHDEIRAVKIPVQIVAPEFDDYMSLEMKAFCNKEIPKAGVVYSYMHFPGVHHGFAGRGDKENPLQKGSLERAGRVMAGWCREWLYN